MRRILSTESVTVNWSPTAADMPALSFDAWAEIEAFKIYDISLPTIAQIIPLDP